MSNDTNTPATPPVPPAIDATLELKAKLDTALAALAAMEKREQERKANEEATALATAYPGIKDWSVVAGKTFEEKKAAAAKLVEMFPKVTATPDAVVNPGTKHTIPPMGAPSGEALNAQVITEKMKHLGEAVSAGNISKTFDLCVELQPKAIAGLEMPRK